MSLAMFPLFPLYDNVDAKMKILWAYLQSNLIDSGNIKKLTTYLQVLLSTRERNRR